MLKLAVQYGDAIDQAFQSIAFDEKYQYYNFSQYWTYHVNIDLTSINKLQMVSVNSKNEVIGYFSGEIDRNPNLIAALGVINFGGLSVTFSRDFYQFLTELFTKHHFNKIEWLVIVGNPAEKMYDKICEKYGGRVIGVMRESARTFDGVMRDVKSYELFQRDFYKHYKNPVNR